MDAFSLRKDYKKFQRNNMLLLFSLLIAIFLSMYFALRLGVADLDFSTCLQVLLRKGDETLQVVLWDIRLPRILAAVVCGAGLGLSGCIMQNNLKNTLASPSTLGINSAAAFGANIGILLLNAGSTQSGSMDTLVIHLPYLVTLCSFCSSMLATIIILLIAKIRSFQPGVIVLAGVAVSSLFSAGITFIQYFAKDHHIASAVFWTFGNLGRISWQELGILTVSTLLAFLYYLAHVWDYNALINGEDSAKSLGVNTKQIRLRSMFFASLTTAISVAFLGMIGFIGLIAPQIMRRIIGNDHRFLIPGSALLGSLVLLISDTVARTILSPTIIPVGVITSFLGAPLFLYILMRDYKN